MRTGIEFSLLHDLSDMLCDTLILPFVQEEQHQDESKALSVKAASLLEGFASVCASPIDSADFTAKEAEIVVLYPVNGVKRVLLLGLGPVAKITAESLRRSYGAICKYARSKKYENITLSFPTLISLPKEKTCKAIAEGLLLANYSFDQNRSDTLKEKLGACIKKVHLMGILEDDLSYFTTASDVSEGVFLARDLVNGNADDITPQHLSKLAVEFSEKFPSISTKVLDKEALEKEGLGLLLAVSRGSSRDPALIIMEYKGALESQEHTVIVGKGVTFDTGGLLIKGRGGMETMRADMAGAACCFGTLLAVALMNMKINVSVVIGATENAIGPMAYKPGDVYKSYVGKTVEISDTDAEGRLVLADALAYAEKHLKPTCMIDLATLTGAMVVSLGEEVAGLFSNHELLGLALFSAGQNTYERVWRLPLVEEYKELLKSDIADLKNTGGRHGGAISAALFLQTFIKDVPWAHIDIAGPAFYNKERHYIPKNGTGFGVRLLIEFLESDKLRQ